MSKPKEDVSKKPKENQPAASAPAKVIEVLWHYRDNKTITIVKLPTPEGSKKNVEYVGNVEPTTTG